MIVCASPAPYVDDTWAIDWKPRTHRPPNFLKGTRAFTALDDPRKLAEKIRRLLLKFNGISCGRDDTVLEHKRPHAMSSKPLSRVCAFKPA